MSMKLAFSYGSDWYIGQNKVVFFQMDWPKVNPWNEIFNIKNTAVEYFDLTSILSIKIVVDQSTIRMSRIQLEGSTGVEYKFQFKFVFVITSLGACGAYFNLRYIIYFFFYYFCRFWLIMSIYGKILGIFGHFEPIFGHFCLNMGNIGIFGWNQGSNLIWRWPLRALRPSSLCQQTVPENSILVKFKGKKVSKQAKTGVLALFGKTRKITIFSLFWPFLAKNIFDRGVVFSIYSLSFNLKVNFYWQYRL